MKVALISPSNLLYMPYVGNYEKILEENNIDYDIINWDRFNIENKSDLTYRDTKIGHQRTYLDYYKFKKFVVRVLKNEKYEKVIVFGIQLAYFLKRILKNKFEGNYIIDIRDNNKIINFFNISSVIENSSLVVLSSPGYKEWLPKNKEYVINHNTQIKSLDELKKIKVRFMENNKVNIAYIGAIRDYQVNMDFIEAIKNKDNIILNFHGEGNTNANIKEFLDTNDINNVYLTGRYNKEEEKKLYEINDIINVLRYNDGINNKTALPNRLYSACIYGKPMLAYEGSLLADLIKKYNLGLVIDSFKDIEIKIYSYLCGFDEFEYQEGRRLFFESVIIDNQNFQRRLKEFLLFSTIKDDSRL